MRANLARLAAAALLMTPPCALAQQPAPPAAPPPLAAPDAPSPLKPEDAFGEEVTLPAQTVISIRGHGTWDSAFETLVDAFASLNEYMQKQNIKPSGPPMTIYTRTDDTGFQFLAAVPIAETPKDPPKGDIAVNQAPSGRALKFTHRGTYEAMDTTYEAITNYLDEKGLEAKDQFIEQYASGPLKIDARDLVVDVYVPVK